MIDAVIILSHRLEYGRWSDEYRNRLNLAIRLFKEKKIKNIILCSETANEDVKNFCIKEGIPAENIFLEKRSKDTIGEAFFTKKDFVIPNNWKSLAIVSSDYHLPRAKEIFEFIYPKLRINLFSIKNGEDKKRNNDQTNSLRKFRYLVRDLKRGDDARIEKRLFEEHNLYKNGGKKNILAIGAHFDDIELGCGGTIAKHIENGDNVTFLCITTSEYSGHDGKEIRKKKEAMQEGINGARVLGIKKGDFICFNGKAKKVKYGQELIEKINKIIDERKIDTIYTHWEKDVHHDHFAVGKSTITAGRHIPRILAYRSNWYTSSNVFEGRFYVDISKQIDKKVLSIRQHKGELSRRGEKWIDFVKHQNRNSGVEVGTEYAEVFEIVKYLAP
ncbi:MAG: ElyC/SanA/YdcF family protein [Nanoarchaeota archaeon]|nr:ElyC/SanA/YdcF family protein [Nanoarchaeota archaeon]